MRRLGSWENYIKVLTLKLYAPAKLSRNKYIRELLTSTSIAEGFQNPVTSSAKSRTRNGALNATISVISKLKLHYRFSEIKVKVTPNRNSS